MQAEPKAVDGPPAPSLSTSAAQVTPEEPPSAAVGPATSIQAAEEAASSTTTPAPSDKPVRRFFDWILPDLFSMSCSSSGDVTDPAPPGLNHVIIWT